jgi:putative sigma-54 modulation protein
VQINISARHGHLSEGSREKITAKVQKLSRIFERLTAIEVAVDLEHPEALSIDLRVSAEHKHDFVATERSEDMMTAIDGAMHKVEQQLRKYKEKVLDRHRSPAPREPGSSTEAAGEE